MAVLCGMSTILYSVQSARLSVRYCLLAAFDAAWCHVTQQSIVTGCLRLTDVSVVCRAFNARPQKIWGVFSYTECTDQGNDFELIPTVKIETSISQTDQLVANVRRSIIITELWRPEFASRGKNSNSWRLFGKTTAYGPHLTQCRLS